MADSNKTVSGYLTGSGQAVTFFVELLPDPTGQSPYMAVVTFDDANKDVQCQMYGQLSAQPADPDGQRNFIQALGRAIAENAQTNLGAPAAARSAFSFFPMAAEAFASTLAIGGEVRKACSWGEASDPGTSLSITVSADGITSDAEVTDTTGSIVSKRETSADGKVVVTDYDTTGVGLTGTIGPSTSANADETLTLAGNGLAENLSPIQAVNLVGNNNRVVVQAVSSQQPSSGNETIDLGAKLYSSNDTLDFTQYGQNVYLGTTTSADGKGQAAGLYTNGDMTAFTGLSFAGMTTLNLGGGDNKINISMAADPYLHTINMGGGNNVISTGNINLTINLGDGNDTVKSTGASTTVKAGSGVDKIEASHNGQLLIENATANTADRITYYGNTLTGGVHWGGSESVYAYGIHGERYGRNKLGDLVIVDNNGNETFIPGFNFGTDGTNRTAGIEVLDISFKLARSNMWTSSFETAAAILCAEEKAGEALFGWKPSGMKDPLVLDLNGAGISLSAEEGSGVSFDINNNGFAAPVGWVNADDGFLVRDLNGNGKIDNDGEMFGGPSASGFSQLALLDGNGDGKVDASDNGLVDFNGDGVVDSSDTFDSLKIWVDANQNGVTDAGELHSLSDYNIVSIAAGSTPSAELCSIRANRRDRSFSTRRGFRSMRPSCRSKTSSSMPRRAWPLPSRSRPVRAGSSHI